MAANPTILAGLKSYMSDKGIGGPVTGVPANAKNIATNKTALDDTADLRDSISALVGAGYTGKTQDPNISAHQNRILSMLPAQEAQNLLTHIAVQNQAPGVITLNPAQRLQRFYDIQSSIPSTNNLLQKVKTFGTGPLSAFTDTPDVTNQKMASIVAKK